MPRAAALRGDTYAVMIHGTSDLMVLIDRNLIYREANRAFLEACRLPRAALIGRAVTTAIRGAALLDPLAEASLRRALQGERVHYRARCELTPGTARHMAVAYDPVRDPSGRVRHVVVTCQDRSEPTPIAGAMAGNVASPEPSLQRLGDRRVLVVDDNPLLVDILAAQIHRRGLTVAGARSGKEALEFLASGGYDLMLLDWQMPGLDGRAVARVQRAREAANDVRVHLPIVAITASEAAHDREECLAAGMDDFLTKPVSSADIDRILLRWLPASGGDASDPVDPQALAEIDDPAAPSFLARIVRLFLADAPTLGAALAAAVRGGDWQAMAHSAHALKGSASHFGARHLVQACDAALHASRHNGAGAAEVAARIDHELARVDAALRQIVTARRI